MTRHAQPREVAELKGAMKVHPERYRNEVPTSNMPLGLAPEYMSEDAKRMWFEIEGMAVDGVLKAPHRLIVEIAANGFAAYRKDPDNYPANKMGHLISCCARLGFSPADQQHLKGGSGSDENPFDRYVK